MFEDRGGIRKYKDNIFMFHAKKAAANNKGQDEQG